MTLRETDVPQSVLRADELLKRAWGTGVDGLTAVLGTAVTWGDGDDRALQSIALRDFLIQGNLGNERETAKRQGPAERSKHRPRKHGLRRGNRCVGDGSSIAVRKSADARGRVRDCAVVREIAQRPRACPQMVTAPNRSAFPKNGVG